MTAASWVITGLTFLGLSLILTALLREDAGKKPLPLAEMWAWSQMQLDKGAQCARQLLLKDDLRRLIDLRIYWGEFQRRREKVFLSKQILGGTGTE